MWEFIADWRILLWVVAISLIATGIILRFMPPSEILHSLDEDVDSAADQPVTPTAEGNLDTTVPSANRDTPPPLPLWRQKQRNEEATAIVRWISEEIATAPDDAAIVFKLYAEVAEVHSILLSGTMITAIEIYAQFLRKAADWEKKHGVVHTFSAEVIWGGETRGWMNFTL